MEDKRLVASMLILFMIVVSWVVSSTVLIIQGNVWGVVLAALAAFVFLLALLFGDH